MRAYELTESKRNPKVGDKIDFPDDTITDKGPCSGSILKIDGDTVWFGVSDTVFETKWKSFIKNTKTNMTDECWTFENKDGAHKLLIDYDIDSDEWKEKGMPPNSDI